MFVDEMEAKGYNKDLVRLNLDDSFTKKFSEKIGNSVEIDVVHKLADKCLANEWLKHDATGVDKYDILKLTTTGMGIVRSRQLREARLAERSFLKRSSDYIEDHKGLFAALAVTIALVGLLVRLFYALLP